MAREPSQKLVDYSIIAGIALAGYAVWTMFFKKEAPKECPRGQHAVNPCDGLLGWPAFLCNAGRNITGAFLDCKPDVPGGGLPCADVGGAKCKSEGGTWKDAPDCTCTGSTPPGNLNCECPPGQSEWCVTHGGKWHECMDDRKTPRCECVYPPPVVLPKDDHGCIIGVQHYCDNPDRKCRDLAQKCTPLTGKPGDCYEWDVLSGWIYSPSIPGCGVITCPDGSQHYKENCPVIVDPCPASECIPTSTICADGIPKVCVEGGAGCRDRGIWSPGGNACKPVSKIVDCPGCGLIDLANTPDGHLGTCAELCKPLPKTCDWNCAQPACNSINFTGSYRQFAGGTQASCESHGAYYHIGNSWDQCWNRAAQRQNDCFKDCGC